METFHLRNPPVVPFQKGLEWADKLKKLHLSFILILWGTQCQCFFNELLLIWLWGMIHDGEQVLINILTLYPQKVTMPLWCYHYHHVILTLSAGIHRMVFSIFKAQRSRPTTWEIPLVAHVKPWNQVSSKKYLAMVAMATLGRSIQCIWSKFRISLKWTESQSRIMSLNEEVYYIFGRLLVDLKKKTRSGDTFFV